jgi:hypothetical protein
LDTNRENWYQGRIQDNLIFYFLKKPRTLFGTIIPNSISLPIENRQKRIGGFSLTQNGTIIPI